VNGEPIKCIQCGLGPIGCGIVREAAARPNLQLVGAVDTDPAKLGQDAAAIAGMPRPTGIAVQGSMDGLPEADLVLHSTGSRLADVGPQLQDCLGRGLNCISTAEELTWPWLSAPDLAGKLDALARERGVRVLGTGINPGFVLDLLPMVLTMPCAEVQSIRATRVVDTTTRRPQLQAKTGLGMSEHDYSEHLQRQAVGHVGLRESAALLAAGLGWPTDSVVEMAEPVLAQQPVQTEHYSVRSGHVLGSHQMAVARVDGVMRVHLDLAMYAHAPEPHDEVVIQGRPPLTVRIDGGIPGDDATPACVLNTIPAVLSSPPGLLTMKDITVPRWARG
jgi:hypothetical protein